MKKHSFAIAVMLLCMLLLAGCTNSGDTQTAVPDEPTQSIAPAFDLDEYKELVSKCRADMNEASIFLSNTGQYEFNYWKAYDSVGGGTPEGIVDSAFEWLSEKSEATRETVDADYESIRKQYKEIILIEIEGREAEEIDASFRSMYDAYSSMYNLVTSPSGGASGFGNSLSDHMKSFMEADEDLSLFLGDESENTQQ